jgi:hypothetical protein
MFFASAEMDMVALSPRAFYCAAVRSGLPFSTTYVASSFVALPAFTPCTTPAGTKNG